MQVGYYRSPADNQRTRKINAISYYYYGMELVCFGPEDVDITQKKINGKIFSKGKWIRKKVDIPIIINNTPYKNDKEIYNFLEENSFLMFKKYKDKEDTNETLLRDGEFSKILIPTKGLTGFSDIEEFIKTYNTIILKPRNGSQGRGIYSLTKENNNYYLSYGNSVDVLNEREIYKFIEKIIDKKYIIQKKVKSNNAVGQPFDVRLQFEKNGKGKWVTAQSYVRIGGNQKIVSNISKGGSVIRLKPFLKANYGEEWEDYFKKLKKITKGLPHKIEEINNANIVSLAFDFGLEENKFYLYEVNYFPGGTYARGEVATLRAAYTKHLLETEFNINPND